MQRLRNYVLDEWYLASTGHATLVDPCSEETIAQLSSSGLDFGRVLEHAREHGGAALRAMSIGERGLMLLQLSQALQAGRDELIALSLRNTGATRKDAKFDIDGGIFTLSYYGQLGQALGTAPYFLDGAGVQLGRSPRYWGQHLLLPLHGVALHINAFNFPVWGFAEKAACALLAGVPVLTKPASSSAMVAERAVELLVDSGVLPRGSFSMICGSTGDLVDRLGPQDVLAFTGSAETALKLRSGTNLLRKATRVNIEADSLNSAILAPGVGEGDETWSVFVRDVAREITQKSGQKCTAVRRILVPSQRMDRVQQALIEQLSTVVTGNPEDGAVTMGPLATRRQLDDAVQGVAQLQVGARVVFGTGSRCDGLGNPKGRGYFFAPVLLRADDAHAAVEAHRLEVFGPVATLMGYDGSAAHAAEIVALGQGSLVTSLYGDDREFVRDYIDCGGQTSGRLYIGSEKVAGQLPGSGVAMPQLLHGGPGRAGGGSELGGERGLELYFQRVALSGDRSMIERLSGTRQV